MYRVAWRHKLDKKNVGHSDWFPDKALIQAWVDHGNRYYPYLDHWLEEESKSGKEEETAKQTPVPGKPVGDSSPSTSD